MFKNNNNNGNLNETLSNNSGRKRTTLNETYLPTVEEEQNLEILAQSNHNGFKYNKDKKNNTQK